MQTPLVPSTVYIGKVLSSEVYISSRRGKRTRAVERYEGAVPELSLAVR